LRKVIGIGETILDIIFRNDQPKHATPGGSVFNCMVSLGRCRIPVFFISELGKDPVGQRIRTFMHQNHISTDYIDFFEDGSSPVALAFLNEQSQAEYQFFREFPAQRLRINLPEIHANDIFILGSYYAVDPAVRPAVFDLITCSKERKAIVYYDINFRPAHAHERERLMEYFLENIACATIVRCSDEDLHTLFPQQSLEMIYEKYFAPRCPLMIITQGDKETILKTGLWEKKYPVQAVQLLSTVGAGDSFNAGLIYGLMQHNILAEDIAFLPEIEWDRLIAYAHAFAAEVCGSYENYISEEFNPSDRK
jgi:fructokinase